ncbi:hypothetical protein E1B28_000341 [Marasmius oreades]|uniref:Protein YAE1 n=1 Tax=Marasmius oreades TaxID=181124 RepID=A0A9P8AEC9_9AGAR|nr:uncharacterized protein E1B28_000341 [Marasmius oreades]KAG7098383.1 hypothetical protein E1B28_000341 [Marasmius oreades]
MDFDSPWDENPHPDSTRDAEWTKMSSEFTNAGYREGITAGKESTLQEGFDSGFAQVGAPIGREIGLLRGVASGLVSYLSTSKGLSDQDIQLVEAREIAAGLSGIRFSDIAPRDLEAEQHAREHLEMEGKDADDDMDINEELAEKRKMEGLEDMLSRLAAETHSPDGGQKRPTTEDVQRLKVRLQTLTSAIGLPEAILWG